MSLSSGYFPAKYPGYSTGSYWLVGLGATILFFGSVLRHELCHAAMGNRLGEEVHRITLFILGGMADLEHEPRSGIDELKIAAVGPLSLLVMAGIFWLIARGVAAAPATALWESVFSYLAFINLALAPFNLLPGFPLDGGRLLRAALWMHWGDLRRATAAAADWGNTKAWGLIALGALKIFAGGRSAGCGLYSSGCACAAPRQQWREVTLLEHPRPYVYSRPRSPGGRTSSRASRFPGKSEAPDNAVAIGDRIQIQGSADGASASLR